MKQDSVEVDGLELMLYRRVRCAYISYLGSSPACALSRPLIPQCSNEVVVVFLVDVTAQDTEAVQSKHSLPKQISS